MYKPDHVKTSPDFPIPDTMRAWVLGDPDQLTLTKKPVPVPLFDYVGAIQLADDTAVSEHGRVQA